MSTHHEAVRLNLEYYRKAAKSLLKSAESGDPKALERIAPYTTKRGNPPALHQAQLAIAREQGFASWPRLWAFLTESSLDFHGQVAAFVTAALEDLRRAEDLLKRRPELAAAGFYTALLLGDRGRVAHAVGESAEMATRKGGPREWEPLLYVCFSRFANGKSSRAHDLEETARLLLAHGANPNAFYVDQRWPDSPLPCLYAATGLSNNVGLARVLLEAGARPDDGESLYHSTEHADLQCLRLLLEHGASPVGNNGLKHMLDREDKEGLQLLLAAGADPTDVNQRGETALHWAVWRGRGTEIVARLLDAGANVNSRRADGRTAYALAVRSGQGQTAALLRSHGADTDIPAADRFLGACASAGPADRPRILANSPEVPLLAEYHQLLPEFASSHHSRAIGALLAAGVPVDTRGDNGGTALHWACWKGYADLVEMLIDAGASLTVEDKVFHATPAGWFSHGLENCGEGDGDYPQVARLLLNAGAAIADVDMPTGDAAVDAVLREHGLIP